MTLCTIYCNILPPPQITATTLVAEVVEQVVTTKAMPPNNYALYLVLGDSESHRVLGFSERLLAVLCSTGSDCFLCLKPNLFADTLQPYVRTQAGLGHGVSPLLLFHVC